MANESLNFTINLNGNAYKGILQIDDAVEQVIKSVESASSGIKNFADTLIYFLSIKFRVLIGFLLCVNRNCNIMNGIIASKQAFKRFWKCCSFIRRFFSNKFNYF